MAKRLDSQYEPGERNGAWVKFPLKQRGRFLIGGYRPAGPNLFFRGGKFVFAGKVRQLLGKFTRAEVFHAVRGLETVKCPFAFREWTRFKVLRHAEFVSLG